MVATAHMVVSKNNNKYVGPRYRQAEMYANRIACESHWLTMRGKLY